MKHPITPPPELVQQWMAEPAPYDADSFQMLTVRPAQLRQLATRAAQWGADQELEACCEWLEDVDCNDPQETAKLLRAARRPVSPSLKVQALELARPAGTDGAHVTFGPEELALIRRALEQLDD